MRLGVVLPSFARTADESLDAVAACEEAGIHGAFVFDHLWPIREPGRPALAAFPLLGTLAAATTKITLGTLVARVGIVSNAALVSRCASVHAASGGRFIAGLGTGDRKSADELDAFGLENPPASERRQALVETAEALGARGIETWIGGGSPRTDAIARSLGVTLNRWSAPAAEIALAAADGPVTWGGSWRDGTDRVELLGALRDAGATWAVLTWPGSVDQLVVAAHAAGIALGL